MDYGAVVRDAWRLTWRNRFLWILGIFAGGAVGAWISPGMRWRFDQNDAGPVFGEAAAWAASNTGLVVGGAILLGLLGLLLLGISLVSQGAMARATADLANGQATSLGRAWTVGVHLFWRFVGLWLLTVAAFAAVAALIIGVFFAVSFAVSGFDERPRVVLAILSVLVMLPVGIVLAIGANIVLAYAERAIAINDVGPMVALRSGARLLRQHFGDSLVTWVLGLGLGFVLTVGTAAVIGVLALVLGGPGVILALLAGLSAPTITYAAVAGLVVLIAGLLTLGVVNAFFWNYWTLAYLRLSGR